MKKITIILSSTTFLMVAFFSSCSSPAQKVENKKDNVVEANKELEDATDDYIEDMAAFRKENADKIAANEKSIADFKARIASQKQDAKADYTKKVLELEKKNSDFKKKLEEYKETSKEKWDLFKAEFNRDMNELNASLKDFTTSKNK